QDGLSPATSRQTPGGCEVGPVERVEGPGATAGNSRRDDLVVRIVVERARERGSVEGVVDGAPQSSIPKQWAPGVEDEIVLVRQGLAKVPLLAGPGGGARGSKPLIENASGREQRVVVEVTREIVDRPGVGPRDGLRCPDVARIDDPLRAAWPLASVVRIPQQDRAVIRARSDVVGTGGGNRRTFRIDGLRDRDRTEVEHGEPRQEVAGGLRQGDGEHVAVHRDSGDMRSLARAVSGRACDLRAEGPAMLLARRQRSL